MEEKKIVRCQETGSSLWGEMYYRESCYWDFMVTHDRMWMHYDYTKIGRATEKVTLWWVVPKTPFGLNVDKRNGS